MSPNILPKSTKTIIAVCGLAGSGKDTACDHLCTAHGFQKISFATPLKQMVKIAFDFTDEQLYGPSSKREEQDKRYPFSGTCVRCGQECYQRSYDPSGEEIDWCCKGCGAVYPTHINARIALQMLGTEWGRRLTPDIWANAAVNFINASKHDRWCISDLRFINEFNAVRANGGKIIRLMRGSSSSSHQSEAELQSIPLSDFDMIIHNFGELKQLFIGLDAAVEQYT